MNAAKEKILGASGSVTGALSVLGGYQVCHNVCMGLVAFLTFFGFAVAGMPLFFLTRVAVPFWIAAAALLLVISFFKYAKRLQISDKMILLNSGLIIAGVPFQSLQEFNYIFWITGGVLIISSIGWYFHDKFIHKK